MLRSILLMLAAAALIGIAAFAARSTSTSTPMPTPATAESTPAAHPAPAAAPENHEGSCPRSGECKGEGCFCPVCRGENCGHHGSDSGVPTEAPSQANTGAAES